MNYSQLIKAISVPVLLSAAPVCAQNATGDDGEQQDGVAAGESTLTVVGAPLSAEVQLASVTVINETDIAIFQNGAVSDLLSRTVGVTVSRNGPLGGFTGVRIRGAEAEQTLTLINGVRVGDPTSPGGGFDYGTLMTTAVDRIEVLRGANSVVWGSDAIGGVVSITTLRPHADGNDPTTGRIVGEWGSPDTRRLSAQLRSSGGFGDVAIGGGYVDSAGISSAASGTERDGFRQYSVNLSSRHPLGASFAIETFGMVNDSRLELDGFAPPLFAFGDTAEFQESREHYAAVSLLHTPAAATNGAGFSQRLSLSLADINRDTFDPANGTAPGFSARGRTERAAYQADWRPLTADDGSDMLRIIAGAEAERSIARTASSFSSDRGKTGIQSLYAQVLAQPAAQLTLSAGVRQDQHDDFGGATTLSASLGYGAGPLRAWASYREGFKAPTLFQLSSDPGAFGNPALRPERSTSYEIGSAVALGDAGQLSVALWQRNSRNLIDFVGCTGPAAPAICASGNRPFGTYDNVALARARGVEVSAAAQIAPDLSFTINYSFTDTEDRAATSVNRGNRLARRPRHSLAISALWALLRDRAGLNRLTLSPELQLVGAAFDDRANRVRLGAYTLVNLRAAYHATDDVEIFARVENMFDERYETVAGYSTYGRTVAAGVRWAL